MIKNVVKLAIKKDEKVYSFECDNNAPLGEIYDSLSEMRNYVIEIMNKNAEKSNEEEKPQANEESREEES